MKLARNFFGHIGFIFVMAVTVFGVAIALVFLERCAEAHGMPPWLLEGMHYVALFLFILHGVLVVGASIIVTIKLLRKLWKEDE